MFTHFKREKKSYLPGVWYLKLTCLRTTEPLFRTYEVTNLRTTEPLEQKAVNVVVGLTNLRTHEPKE